MRWAQFVQYVLPAVITFAAGVVVARLTAWQSRRTTLETRVQELENANHAYQIENDKLRRRVAEVERVLRAFRGYAGADDA